MPSLQPTPRPNTPEVFGSVPSAVATKSPQVLHKSSLSPVVATKSSPDVLTSNEVLSSDSLEVAMQELASAGGEGNEFVQLVSLDGANLAVESWKAQGLEALRVSPDLNDQDMQEIQAEIFQAAYEGDLDTL